MSRPNGTLGRPVTIRAHAKINLDLRVLGTRPDGFHELRTVFQALALHDTIECIPREGPFAIECDAAGVPLDRSNLVWRAADALWRSLRRDGPVRDVLVRIQKRIPLQGGLGGGSTDAAATLLALARGLARAGSSESARGRGGHARRRRRVLSVRRHGARPWPRRRDLSARRSAASLDRAAGAGIRRVHAATRTAGTTPSATMSAASAARGAARAWPVAVARGADDQRPRGADRAASSRDRPDEDGAAPGRGAGGGHVRQRIDGIRPLSAAAGRRCGRDPAVGFGLARADDRVARPRRVRPSEPTSAPAHAGTSAKRAGSPSPSALPGTRSLDYTKGLRRRGRAAPTWWGVAKR